MKYIIIENKEQEENALLSDVADFLWNNGNEVIVRNNKNQNFGKVYDCLVLLICGYFPAESLFEKGRETIHKNFDLKKSNCTKSMLIFSKNGVYSNAIPFPHKIYHFNTLDKKSLSEFFIWSKKLNLFTSINV